MLSAPVKGCTIQWSPSGAQLSCWLLQVKWQIPPPEQCPASGYIPSCTAMCEADARRAAAAVQRTRQAGHSWLQAAPAVAVGPMPGSPVAGGMDGERCCTMLHAALPCPGQLRGWVLRSWSPYAAGMASTCCWLALRAALCCTSRCEAASTGARLWTPCGTAVWRCSLPVLTGLYCYFKDRLSLDCATHCSQADAPAPASWFLTSAARSAWPIGLVMALWQPPQAPQQCSMRPKDQHRGCILPAFLLSAYSEGAHPCSCVHMSLLQGPLVPCTHRPPFRPHPPSGNPWTMQQASPRPTSRIGDFQPPWRGSPMMQQLSSRSCIASTSCWPRWVWHHDLAVLQSQTWSKKCAGQGDSFRTLKDLCWFWGSRQPSRWLR